MAHATSRPPFDDIDADIVLRSSDEVDFRVYRVIIAKASPVFRDMLAIPNDEENATETPPIITLSEDAQTLDHLLRLCYPIERPDTTNLDDLVPVLRAADKYHIPHAMIALERDLTSLAQREPLRIFALAYLYKFGELARTAARRLLHSGPNFACPRILPQELDVLPASALSRVLKYQRDCVQAALSVTEDAGWTIKRPATTSRPVIMYDEFEAQAEAAEGTGPAGTLKLDWVWLNCRNSQCEKVHMRPGEKAGRWVPKWFADYIELVRKNLGVRPVGSSVLAEHPRLAAFAVQGSKCSYCASAYQDLWEFSYELARAIDHGISQVTLNLPAYFEASAPSS